MARRPGFDWLGSALASAPSALGVAQRGAPPGRWLSWRLRSDCAPALAWLHRWGLLSGGLGCHRDVRERRRAAQSP